MLNRLHKTVKTYLNTEGRGNVSPERLDFIIHNKVLEKQEDVIFEANRLVNRQNRGLVNGALENTAEKTREKIQHYLDKQTITSETNEFEIPIEVAYFDTVIYQSTFIEMCKNNKEYLLSKGEADEVYPIGLKSYNTIEVFPDTIRTITVSYLRKPLIAKWTYTVFEGQEMYDPSKSDFQDIDIHPSEEADLTIRVLQGLGINLKEKDIQSITEQFKNTEFNQENRS